MAEHSAGVRGEASTYLLFDAILLFIVLITNCCPLSVYRYGRKQVHFLSSAKRTAMQRDRGLNQIMASSGPARRSLSAASTTPSGTRRLRGRDWAGRFYNASETFEDRPENFDYHIYIFTMNPRFYLFELFGVTVTYLNTSMIPAGLEGIPELLGHSFARTASLSTPRALSYATIFQS